MLTNSTSFNIVLDEGSHSRPPVVFFDGIESLDFSRVSGGDFVMKLGGDFSSKLIILRNIVLSFKLFRCPVFKIVLEVCWSFAQ